MAEYLVPGRATALSEVISVAVSPVWQYLLAQRAPLVVHTSQADFRLAPLRDHLRRRGAVSVLALPLTIEAEVIGSLELEATAPRPFSAGEVSLAWSVADQVAGALARTRLVQKQRLLSTAAEQAAEIVMITDVAGTLVYVNPAFERISGYSRAEVIGQNPRFLRSGQQDAAFYTKLWARLTAGSQVWHGRLTNKKKDGTHYIAEVTITPVRGESGAIVNYVGIERDVTNEV